MKHFNLFLDYIRLRADSLNMMINESVNLTYMKRTHCMRHFDNFAVTGGTLSCRNGATCDDKTWRFLVLRVSNGNKYMVVGADVQNKTFHFTVGVFAVKTFVDIVMVVM